MAYTTIDNPTNYFETLMNKISVQDSDLVSYLQKDLEEKNNFIEVKDFQDLIKDQDYLKTRLDGQRNAPDYENLFNKVGDVTVTEFTTEESVFEAGEKDFGHFKDVINKSLPDAIIPKDGEHPGNFDYDSADKPVIFIAPIKGRERSREKVMGKYQGDWRKLTDVVRGTISVNKLSDLENVAKSLTENGLEIVEFENKYREPTPAFYRDMKVAVKLPNGTIAELQLNTHDMMKAKIEGHKYYEVARPIMERAIPPPKTDEENGTVYEMNSKQRDLYNGIWEGQKQTLKN